jgi:hypothetical protein
MDRGDHKIDAQRRERRLSGVLVVRPMDECQARAFAFGLMLARSGRLLASSMRRNSRKNSNHVT